MNFTENNNNGTSDDTSLAETLVSDKKDEVRNESIAKINEPEGNSLLNSTKDNLKPSVGEIDYNLDIAIQFANVDVEDKTNFDNSINATTKGNRKNIKPKKKVNNITDQLKIENKETNNSIEVSLLRLSI